MFYLVVFLLNYSAIVLETTYIWLNTIRLAVNKMEEKKHFCELKKKMKKKTTQSETVWSLLKISVSLGKTNYIRI